MQSIRTLAAIILGSLAAGAAWWLADRPVPVQAEWSEPLSSVSFAPFRRGQSPLTKVYPKPEQVEADLNALVGKTKGIRTYTLREGLEQVPDIAAKLGLKITVGASLYGEAPGNEAEIKAVIAAANAHPDSIQRVIVGNEVLLRRDLTPDELIAAIRKVKAAIKQPVSYADVWAFYLKYPQVAREVDFITIHILPFWEDEPVAIENEEAYVVKIVEKVRAAFPGKPILIGEVGWPSLGRDRGPAVVSTVNQARFVRQMAGIAARHDFDYNIVEAFDQPWKSALENTVGAAWGVLDADRKPKFPMTGPVREVQDWCRRAAWALGIGAVLTLAFGRRLQGFGTQLGFSLGTQFLTWLMVTTACHSIEVTLQNWELWWLPIRVLLPALVLFSILARCRDWLLDPATALQGVPPAYFGKSPVIAAYPWHGQWWMVLSAIYAVVWTGCLLFDGRYRDIPDIDFLVPVGGLALMLGLRLFLARRQGGSAGAALSLVGLFPGRRPFLAPLLTWLLPISAAAALASEGIAVIGEDFAVDHPRLADQIPYILKATISNPEMNLWALMLVIWAVPFVLLSRRSAAN